MTEWYEVPYESGPPVKVDGFPRPLYPPDASTQGKHPSSDGDDVIAYKRTICRLGRWGDWNPSSWDDSYSNNFAHGKSGNVADTGVAGFQRQQDIDDTGWFGEKSFNELRSSRVPKGPHKGDMAMDAEAVRLINRAYAKFQGHEPDLSVQTVRQASLDLAQTQLGVKEEPPNSNRVKYTSWYNMVGPWCAMFVTWCYETNKLRNSPTFVRGEKYAYVPYIVADARNKRNGLRVVGADNVIPGDLVCYDWQWNDEFDHVGIFERWAEGSGSTFTAIEGNTSISNDSNGGEVMRRTRRVPDQSTVFVRVEEP